LAALERRRHSVGAIAVVIVLALCGFALQRLLAEMRLADVSTAIASLPIRAPLASLMLTCGSFLVLVGYDWSALRYVGRRLPLRIVALGSFCGYAIGNTVGFALLSGGSVRFRIYSAAGLASEDVGRVALFCVTAFGFGICAISGLGVLIRPSLLAHILAVPVALLQAVSVALILAIGTFLVMCWQRRTIRWRGLSLPLPSVSLAAGQLAISALDVCLAGAALWVLLPHQLGFSYLAFLPLYCVAIVAGVMSHVPGGLGVFEAVILFALDDHSEASLLVGALVIYRLIYYVLPLVAAGVFLGLNELRLLIPATSGTMRRVIDLTSAMVPTVASVLIVFAAIVLFASGATPMLPERTAVLSAILPLPLVEAAHFLAGLTATALLLLAPALQRRLNGAYWFAQAALVAGIGCSLAKGLDYEEATALAAIAMILVPYRREFYRPTSLLDQPFTVGWMIAIVGILRPRRV
jgi:phosphatidylglycerol lysyltransferase